VSRALVYLHGFASSPRSSKAQFFASRAAAAGLRVDVPDLNQPDFHSLTVTRMLDAVDASLETLREGPVALVGSSLGALVAVLAADRRARGRRAPEIDRLILLAPALDLVRSLESELGVEALADWQQRDRRDVFHYSDNQTRALGWGFMADARGYDAFGVQLDRPVLIYQGTRDLVVSPASVERWAAERPGVTLRLVDDGHQLLDHMQPLWDDVARFIGDGA
jgi:pimeloyl-ACP methyl ester carboxylesterase